eukprot:CAMPEP_0115091672 /NCGR_PEP_ID=MMETSP0227-20121206/26258_1 /TAXON_ID=89957 /ORGANISM="Polarella glacialis, Strain CCMP 1383" /LENGTH=43 /DNA_ID= /DNA_START= /DNA_END= /DNA_ORIENTATION=
MLLASGAAAINWSYSENAALETPEVLSSEAPRSLETLPAKARD